MFYYEAAGAQPGRLAGAAELADWLFTETQLGDVLYRLIDRLGAVEDPRAQFLQNVLIPYAYRTLRPSAG